MFRRLLLALCLAFWSLPLVAEVRSLEIIERSPFAGGATFGAAGRYETLRGVAHFEVDPAHPRNAVIVDIEFAPRNSRGRVEFEADVFFLAPIDVSNGNRALFYDVNNRGRKIAVWAFNSAPFSNSPRSIDHAGNGFLLRKGYTVVWCGWIGELIPGADKLLLRAPIAEVDGKPIRGMVRQELVTDDPVDSMPLSRRVGHGSYRPTAEGEKSARLTWRLRETDERVPIPRGQWRLEQLPLESVERGVSGTLPEIRLHLEGGFRPGSIYELIYDAEGPIVQGLGFAATRDLISFLRSDDTRRNPFRVDSRAALRYAYGFGSSQSGRFLRNFVHLGFNVDEAGRKVFDGLIPSVAGAGLGFFNFRFAQPNRHNGQHEDHLFTADRFPFTYGPSVNPFTGEKSGILVRTGTEDPSLLPKIMHTQSTGEYWNRAGSLVHTDPSGRQDAPIPDNVRVYSFGGTQHGPAGWPPVRGPGQNLQNPADYTPFLRALLVALDAWARHGTEPPPSVYPRIDDGSLVPWDQSSTRFPALPSVRYPRVIQQPHELDFGTGFDDGLLTVLPPTKVGDFAVLVPKCDSDGNELGTLRPPEVAVPLATHTGWNLRHRDRGAEDMLASLAGSFLPFSKTRAERQADGDPRASIEERYESFLEYRTAILQECDRLVERRYLLREDKERLLASLGRYASLFPKSWVVLSEEHLAAVNRHRRVVVNCDTISGDRSFGGNDPAKLVKSRFEFINAKGSLIDSVWWGWGEGHQAPWPSKTMPLYDAEGYRKWVAEGVDIAKVFVDASKKRGIEAFYNYRINGSDNDLGPVRKIPMKEEHPEWLIHTWNANGYWNFAFEGVRKYKLSILREIAERYDYDGLSLDFARVCPVLEPGRAWEDRDKLTDFMRSVRAMTLEVARERGRPLLLGARVPENLEGCHFDGLDVETWAREQLLDVFAPGARNFDVDVAAFRRIARGTAIKIYPCVDDHHASDGYATPPIEIYRGVAAKWWHQGADGIQTFNFNHGVNGPYHGLGKTHLRAYREIGDPNAIRFKDKFFVVQRRGGGHGTTVVPNPEDWSTPRLMYFNTNMFEPLPATIDNSGKVDTLLKIYVADDVASHPEKIKRLTLRLLLSDPVAASLPVDQRLASTVVATIGHADNGLKNIPPAKGIERQMEVRLNNLLLPAPIVDGAWLVFDAAPRTFALGENLVGVRVTERPPGVDAEIAIEKLEVHVQWEH